MSAFLTQKGWKVVLLEKQHHPRFHIGESLLPLNMPIIDRLGVRQEVESIGMLKPGAEFNYAGYKPTVYYFSNALDKNFPVAYQVRRSEFDHILLRNSARLGTDVREGLRVTDIEFRPGQPPACTPKMNPARSICGKRNTWSMLPGAIRSWPAARE